MARQRRTSQVLETAQRRLSGLKAIKPPANLGPNISPHEFEAKTANLDGRLESHNQKIGELDDDANDLDSLETELNDWNRRILSGVEAQYGSDSSEYELVGGTRKSDRKKPTRKGSGGGTPPPKP